MIPRFLLSLLDNPARRLDPLARQIADLSSAAVLNLVAGRTDRMTLCETRGYIRARAACEIRRQVRLSLANGSADAGLGPQLVRKATDRVVPVVLRRLAALEAPAPQHLLRAA
ncbi:hypothetical protein OAS39_09625 [Pirellulales bacterium]|nr:hypothetical protein [Pirellulales bacterium]